MSTRSSYFSIVASPPHDEDDDDDYEQNNLDDEENNEDELVTPLQYLQDILFLHGIDSFECIAATPPDGFFLPVTPNQIAGYDMELVRAVRNDDVATLKRLYNSGRCLQCCNQFHESIVHTGCRQGSLRALKFLKSVGVSFRVRCDGHRNPLHDACWSNRPNFDLIKVLLNDSPDLLYFQDRHGYTPLSYVPRDCWGDWFLFLDHNQSLLLPRGAAVQQGKVTTKLVFLEQEVRDPAEAMSIG